MDHGVVQRRLPGRHDRRGAGLQPAWRRPRSRPTWPPRSARRRPDSMAPTVALTAPAAGATVSGSVNVTLTRPTTWGWWACSSCSTGTTWALRTPPPVLGGVEHPRCHQRHPHLAARARDAAATSRRRRRARSRSPTLPRRSGGRLRFREGGGTTVAEPVLAANNGTVSGRGVGDGPLRRGVVFDGTTMWSPWPTPASLDLRRMTLEAWVNPAAVPTNGAASWQGAGDEQHDVQLAANSNTTVCHPGLHRQRGAHLAGWDPVGRGRVGAPGRHLRRGHAAAVCQRRAGGQPGPDRHDHGHGERVAHRGQRHDGPVLQRHHR